MRYFQIFNIFFLLVFNINYSIAEIPNTIPALKNWQDGNGYFVLNNDAKIVIPPKFYDRLISDAQTFQEELYFLKGFSPEIIKSDSISDGDIFLNAQYKDSLIKNEGYAINIGNYIEINADNEHGVFYGTRSLLQIFKNTDSINFGNAIDFPDYPERAMMIDNGRKYFSIDWIKNHIRILSYFKMNYLHFHISDNQDFRLESKKFPDIMSDDYYSIEEIKDLIQFAKKHHIQIVPEIDMPGHMAAILKNYSDKYALIDKNGFIYNSMIDITKTDARQFMKEIIEEFIDVFPSKYWHLGADEYIYDNFDNFPQFSIFANEKYGNNALPSDTYFDFINWANDLVRSHGKTMRIWNDGLSRLHTDANKVSIDTNIVIEYWVGSDLPQDIINKGFQISNCSIDFLYYILGSGFVGYVESLFEWWSANLFQASKPVVPFHPKYLGAKFHIWCDVPTNETEGHVAVGIYNMLRLFASRTWGAPDIVSNYEDFIKLVNEIGNPINAVFPENPMPGNLVWRKNIYSSSEQNENPANLIIDGNYNTGWYSKNNDEDWATVDLEKIYDIKRIKMFWWSNNPKNYELQISGDSLNWTTFYSNSVGAGKIHELENLEVSGQFVRVLFKEKNGSEYYSLWELEVYGTEKIDVSIKDNIHESKILNCFPNPSHDNMFVNYYSNIQQTVKVAIYDLNGNIISDEFLQFCNIGNTLFSIPVNRLPNGKYFLTVSSIDKTDAYFFLIVR